MRGTDTRKEKPTGSRWIRLCDFLERHGDEYPLPMVVRVLRTMPVEELFFTGDGLIILRPKSNMLRKHLKVLLPTLSKAAIACFDGEIIPKICVSEIVETGREEKERN